jgi:chromosome segregation ATPase
MKGFEENIPKVRPRVRLGRALDEQVAEAKQVAVEESIAPPIAPAVPISVAPPPAVMTEAPASQVRKQSRAVVEVANLARELTTELKRASEVNARLKADLDAALNNLRQAADESAEQRAENERLAHELEKRVSAARDLKGEIELVEAERDGALAQVARLTRELREEKARAERVTDELVAARADLEEAAQSRNALEEIHQALAEARSRIGR